MTTAEVEPAKVLTIEDLLGAKTPLESVPYINALFYGDPGAGKTYELGTCSWSEDFSPMILLDIEGGSMTLRKFPQDRIKVVQVRSIDQLVKIHETLRTKNNGHFKTVGIDSLTEFQKLDMNTVMGEFYEKDPDKHDKDVPNQRAWGKSGERVRRIIRAYRDLPMHFLATAHQADREDERTGRVTTYPSLPGKLRAEVPGFFDIVGHLRAVQGGEGEGVERVLQIAKTERVIAKDRTGALGDILHNPTIPQMWELINKTEERVYPT
jgi:hypothetical protein